MSRTVLLDLRDSELSCYTIGKNGKSGPAEEILTVPVENRLSFSIDLSLGQQDESYLSLPLSLMDFRVLEFPFSDIRKIRELIPFEIDQLVLGGSGAIVFAAHILGRGDGRSRVLVAYTPKDTLRAILDRLKASGIDPKAVISVELAHAVGSSANPGEVADRLLSPAPLEERARIETALGEIKTPTINLRRGEFQYTADTEHTKKSLKLTAVLAILLLLVLTFDGIITSVSTKRENDSIRKSMRQTYQSLFPGEKKISSELYQLKAHMKELKEKQDSYMGVSPLRVLLDLSGVRTPGVSFTEITADRELIVLKGEAPSMSEVQMTKTELEKIFTGLNISDTKPTSQNRTLFTITAKGRKA